MRQRRSAESYSTDYHQLFLRVVAFDQAAAAQPAAPRTHDETEGDVVVFHDPGRAGPPPATAAATLPDRSGRTGPTAAPRRAAGARALLGIAGPARGGRRARRPRPVPHPAGTRSGGGRHVRWVGQDEVERLARHRTQQVATSDAQREAGQHRVDPGVESRSPGDVDGGDVRAEPGRGQCDSACSSAHVEDFSLRGMGLVVQGLDE